LICSQLQVLYPLHPEITLQVRFDRQQLNSASLSNSAFVNLSRSGDSRELSSVTFGPIVGYPEEQAKLLPENRVMEH
jgi:hypothetical protein